MTSLLPEEDNRKEIDKERNEITGVFRKNPQVGVVFFHHFQLRLAEKKTPPPSLLFSKMKKIKGFQIKRSVGWGFFPLFSVEASREKNPTPWGFSRKTPVVDKGVHYLVNNKH